MQEGYWFFTFCFCLCKVFLIVKNYFTERHCWIDCIHMLASLYLISFLVFEASIVLTLVKVNKKSVNNLLSIHKNTILGVKSKKKAKTKKKEYKNGVRENTKEFYAAE